MFLKQLFLLLSLTLVLFATPRAEAIKAAVTANPALLNTPQAKAAMAKKGLTAADVKAKLNLKNSSTALEATSDEISNNVDNDSAVLDEDASPDTANNTKQLNEASTNFNPFSYQSVNLIKEEIAQKQQILIRKKLKRYSSKFFTNKNIINPSSTPTPDNYIISNADTLVIYIYGDRDITYTPTVNNEGLINLPFVGPIHVGGMKFSDLKLHLGEKLKHHFKMSGFYINMKKYSEIQVTLVGDVKAPGLYNLTSFSTIKDLFLASKGLNPTASVRELLIKRNGKIINKIDFYDLLFKGNKITTVTLKQGDIVIVKQAQKLAQIDGYVNNAAIFELKGDETLQTLIKYAGGMKVDASKINIKIKRFIKNEKEKIYKVSYKEASKFQIFNGDKVYIYPLDFTAQESVNIYGNIIRPGSYTLPDDKTINKLLQESVKYGKKEFFLPKTYFDYAVIKRYNDSLEYETQYFNITDVLTNKKIVTIKPQDQIYIFSQNDIFSNAYITTKGTSLTTAGKLQYYPGMTLQDAINASGINGLIDDKIRITTYSTEDFMPKTKFYSLKKEANTKLNPYDEIEVLDYYDTHTLEPVSIKGEVLHPGIVYYEKGMTLKNLLDMVGGFNKKAYTKSISITRYYTDENQFRQHKLLKYDLETTSLENIYLKPYDDVRILKIPKWSDTKTIELRGEVRFPGTYTIDIDERLSSVIERAGGFTEEAFVRGAVFTRDKIKRRQISQYNKELAKIKRQLAIFSAMPANASKNPTETDSLAGINEIITEAEKYQPIGRISIVLDNNLSVLKQSEYDLVLQDKDTLTIPSHVDVVTVFGEVFNPSSFLYHKGLDAEDFIRLASGFSRSADEDSVYIIHADGTSEPAESGWWIFSSYATIEKGDTVVVPIYIKEYNKLELWGSIVKIMTGFAITAASLDTLGVI